MPTRFTWSMAVEARAAGDVGQIARETIAERIEARRASRKGIAVPFVAVAFDGSSAVRKARERLAYTKDGAVKVKTIANNRLFREEKQIAAMLDAEGPREPLPVDRAACIDGPRPCPMVSCPHSTYLEVDPITGGLKLNHPDKEVEDLPERESCVLDVVDDNPDGITLDEAGRILGVSRERIRQVEERLLRKVRGNRRLAALAADAIGLPVSRAAAGGRVRS